MPHRTDVTSSTLADSCAAPPPAGTALPDPEVDITLGNSFPPLVEGFAPTLYKVRSNGENSLQFSWVLGNLLDCMFFLYTLTSGN